MEHVSVDKSVNHICEMFHDANISREAVREILLANNNNVDMTVQTILSNASFLSEVPWIA
jgi:hypothetical protein